MNIRIRESLAYHESRNEEKTQQNNAEQDRGLARVH
jgi:hypothetical protein